MKRLAIFSFLSLLLISEVRAHPTVKTNSKLPSPSLARLRQPPRAARLPQDAKQLQSFSSTSWRAGQTGDLCKSNSDCLGGRKCFTPVTHTNRFLPGFDKPCPASRTAVCICLPDEPKFCKSDSDCETGEVCKGEYFGKKICASRNVNNKLEANNRICIDARALRHFSPDDLVFAEHSTATVLCDENESCATPGHMVKFRGNAMMMKSYCEKVGCTKREMPVNSPSYKAGLRVSSNTDGLEYTAFAARYESRMEEAAMSAAVRMGF